MAKLLPFISSNIWLKNMVKLLVLCFSIAHERATFFFFFLSRSTGFQRFCQDCSLWWMFCNQVFILVIINAVPKQLHIRTVAVVLITWNSLYCSLASIFLWMNISKSQITMNLDKNDHNGCFHFLFIVYIPPVVNILPHIPCVLQEKHICIRIYWLKYIQCA